MILADENIDHSIIAALRKADIDVLAIYEEARGLTDAEIVVLSQNPSRIILTEDKDFADIVFAYETKNICVILLRYSFQDTALITNILLNFLQENPNIQHKFITITTQKIRVRDIGF